MQQSAGSDPPDASLDTSGLQCPLPVLKARKSIARLSSGQTIEIIATDPQSLADFQVFCETGGHTLLSITTEGPTFRFLIARGP